MYCMKISRLTDVYQNMLNPGSISMRFIFFTLFISTAFSFLFYLTPDYNNYHLDWFLGDISLSSDFFSRIIFWGVGFLGLPEFIPVMLFLFIFLIFSSSDSILKILFSISAYPLMMNALIMPRFFSAMVVIIFSIEFVRRNEAYKCFFAFLFACGLHLAAIIFFPIVFLIRLNRYKIFYVVLVAILSAVLMSIQSILLDFYSFNYYRLSEIGLDEIEKSKVYVHYFTAFVFLFFLHKSHKFVDICRVLIASYSVGILISFFYYDLLISRVFHGLSIITLYYLVKCISVRSVSFIILTLLVSPVGLFFTLPRFGYFNMIYAFYLVFFVFMMLVFSLSFMHIKIIAQNVAEIEK